MKKSWKLWKVCLLFGCIGLTIRGRNDYPLPPKSHSSLSSIRLNLSIADSRLSHRWQFSRNAKAQMHYWVGGTRITFVLVWLVGEKHPHNWNARKAPIVARRVCCVITGSRTVVPNSYKGCVCLISDVSHFQISRVLSTSRSNSLALPTIAPYEYRDLTCYPPRCFWKPLTNRY